VLWQRLCAVPMTVALPETLYEDPAMRPGADRPDPAGGRAADPIALAPIREELSGE
jgi:hypothetical protein